MVNIATIHVSKLGSVRISYSSKSDKVDIIYEQSIQQLKKIIKTFWKDVKAIGLSDRNTVFTFNFE